MEHPIGNSRGNSINGKAKKDQRRLESYARQDEFNKLSLEEKLKRLPNPGANRQRARYTFLLNKRAQEDNETKQAKKNERTQKAAEQLIKQVKKGKKEN